jgi:hypothetical protein
MLVDYAPVCQQEWQTDVGCDPPWYPSRYLREQVSPFLFMCMVMMIFTYSVSCVRFHPYDLQYQKPKIGLVSTTTQSGMGNRELWKLWAVQRANTAWCIKQWGIGGGMSRWGWEWTCRQGRMMHVWSRRWTRHGLPKINTVIENPNRDASAISAMDEVSIANLIFLF